MTLSLDFEFSLRESRLRVECGSYDNESTLTQWGRSEAESDMDI